MNLSSKFSNKLAPLTTEEQDTLIPRPHSFSTQTHPESGAKSCGFSTYSPAQDLSLCLEVSGVCIHKLVHSTLTCCALRESPEGQALTRRVHAVRQEVVL